MSNLTELLLLDCRPAWPVGMEKAVVPEAASVPLIQSFRVTGPAGVRYNVLATSSIVAPAAEWTLIGNVTNVTGAALFTESLTNATSRFYQVRQVP